MHNKRWVKGENSPIEYSQTSLTYTKRKNLAVAYICTNKELPSCDTFFLFFITSKGQKEVDLPKVYNIGSRAISPVRKIEAYGWEGGRGQPEPHFSSTASSSAVAVSVVSRIKATRTHLWNCPNGRRWRTPHTCTTSPSGSEGSGCGAVPNESAWEEGKGCECSTGPPNVQQLVF